MARRLALALLLVSLAGCGAGAEVARLLPEAAGEGLTAMPLNGRLVLKMNGPVDPLTVTSRSVLVSRPDGTVLACMRTVSGGSLVVLLVVDQELLDNPPETVEVALLGGSSVHALATQDGRRLARSVRRQFQMQPGIRMESAGPARLISPSAPASGEDPGQGLVTPLVLVFDGPLDPQSVVPGQCPAYPVAGGLALDALSPTVRWTCTGQRFVVTLDWERPHGELVLDLRRCGLRGLEGEAPQPAPRFRIAAASLQ